MRAVETATATRMGRCTIPPARRSHAPTPASSPIGRGWRGQKSAVSNTLYSGDRAGSRDDCDSPPPTFSAARLRLMATGVETGSRPRLISDGDDLTVWAPKFEEACAAIEARIAVLEVAGALDAEVGRVDLQHMALRHDELVFLLEGAGEDRKSVV
mgnify:CR=1 FL=1